MSSTAPVSVIVSVLNEGDRLRETIASVLAADVRPVEVVVVDDGSTDGCANALDGPADGGTSLRVLRRAHEGIAGARGFGASVAAAPILVFLDAHCTVDGQWLEPLVDLADRHDGFLAVPAIANTKRPADLGCGAQLVNDLLSYQWITRVPPPSEVPIAPGGCFALRRETLHDLGGFAAMRDVGLEDVELSLRAWRLGSTILTAPESLVLHDFRRESPYTRRAESWLANLLLTSLLHFDGERLERTLCAAAGFASFASAITLVLSSEWLNRKTWIDRRAVRSIDEYWQAFPSADPGHGAEKVATSSG